MPLEYPYFPHRRILVYGVTGSGKTTLAARIAEITDIPWHSVDDLTFESNWVPVPVEEQRLRIEAICAGPEWILDTAYGLWIDVPLANVELIVSLDYARWFSFFRLFRRSVLRSIDRRLICNGNVETWRGMFSRNSILLWHLKSFKRKRQRIEKWSNNTSGPKVVRLRSQKELDRWLDGLQAP